MPASEARPQTFDTAAHKALAQLRAGQASAVKVLRNGKTEIVIRSEAGAPAWEAKVGADFAHLFENLFAEHGNNDGLFDGFSQTASIETMEQTNERTDALRS